MKSASCWIDHWIPDHENESYSTQRIDKWQPSRFLSLYSVHLSNWPYHIYIINMRFPFITIQLNFTASTKQAWVAQLSRPWKSRQDVAGGTGTKPHPWSRLGHLQGLGNTCCWPNIMALWSCGLLLAILVDISLIFNINWTFRTNYHTPRADEGHPIDRLTKLGHAFK